MTKATTESFISGRVEMRHAETGSTFSVRPQSAGRILIIRTRIGAELPSYVETNRRLRGDVIRDTLSA